MGNPYITEQLDAIVRDVNFVRSQNKMVVNRELETHLVAAKKSMAEAAAIAQNL